MVLTDLDQFEIVKSKRVFRFGDLHDEQFLGHFILDCMYSAILNLVTLSCDLLTVFSKTKSVTKSRVHCIWNSYLHFLNNIILTFFPISNRLQF